MRQGLYDCGALVQFAAAEEALAAAASPLTASRLSGSEAEPAAAGAEGGAEDEFVGRMLQGVPQSRYWAKSWVREDAAALQFMKAGAGGGRGRGRR